jgi:uridine kinase
MVTFERMVTKRDGSKAPFDSTRIRDAITKAILAVECGMSNDLGHRSKVMLRADAKADRFTKEVMSELGKRFNGALVIPIEQIQDITEEVLHRDFGKGERAISSDPESLWMAYMLYRQGRAFVRQGLLSEEDFREKMRPYRRSIGTQQWNHEHRCGTVKELNEWFSGKLPLQEFIAAAEERSESQLAEAAKAFKRMIEFGCLRAIVITGPSASGKTSTTRKAVSMLQEQCPGVRFKALEMDNYFRGHENHEKFHYKVDGNAIEDINYELPHSYDIGLINDHLDALIHGETVFPPRYNFATGVRTWSEQPMKLEPGEILLLDCMHALSPQLTEAIPASDKFRLYIEAMCILEDNNGNMTPWTDVRLMRRMLRDVRTRGHPIPATLWHWQLIRKGERHLLPYVFTADAIIDGGIQYELPVLKHMLNGHLNELVPVFERNPDLFDGRERLRRIMGLLSQLDEATPGQIDLIPPTSVLREFIGGSKFF